MHSISKLLAGSIVAFATAQSVLAGGGGGVKFAGVNIAGFDFGCATDVCILALLIVVVIITLAY